MLAGTLLVLYVIASQTILGYAIPADLSDRQIDVCMRFCGKSCPCPAATPALGNEGVSPAAEASPHPRATVNEFLYRDFDEDKDPDRADMEIIHLTFQLFADVFRKAFASIADTSDTTISRWFPDKVSKNADQDSRDYVRGVYSMMFDEAKSSLRSVFKDNFVADNLDFGNRCRGDTRAYMFFPNSRFHVCRRGLNLPMIPNNANCSSLGNTVSKKMKSLTHTFIHEFSHSVEIGDKAPRSVGHITDVARGDPARSHSLVTSHDKDKQQSTFVNADSYAWFAINAYYNSVCSKVFGDPLATADDVQEDNSPDEISSLT